MEVGLIDVDGKNFPNIALMKISATCKKEEDMVELRFTQIGPEAGDCSSPYKVTTNRECTVGEFIDSVLTQKEWGRIGISDKNTWVFLCNSQMRYKHDKILESTFTNEDLNKTIKDVFARGGWTNMDYVIVI